MIKFAIIFAIVGIVLFVCVPLRVIVFSPISTIGYSLKDILLSLKNRSWNYAPCGFIHAYTGLFGQGKTLSSVRYVYRFYKKYNNKKVYDPFRKKVVTQYVQILSNVHLQIPYTQFVSLKQIVSIANQVQAQNEKYNARFVTLVLGDEFSVQLNSRNFKQNLDPLTLSTILTCRHHGIALIYTAQRFQHVDALLRQVTERVIECKKLWRIECLNSYDAWTLENAITYDKVKPIWRKGYFIKDRDFARYDSIAVVKNLIKDYESGNMFSESKILELQGKQPNIQNIISKKTLKK